MFKLVPTEDRAQTRAVARKLLGKYSLEWNEQAQTLPRQRKSVRLSQSFPRRCGKRYKRAKALIDHEIRC